jgi:hypothetical protein
MKDHGPRPFCPGWYVTREGGSEHYSRTMLAGVLWAVDVRQKILQDAREARQE